MSYDFDLFVIGAGSGGIRASRFSADFGAKVAVAESRYLGGTCVNVGCIPKKLMSYAANYSSELELCRDFGWQTAASGFDWATLIRNKNHAIEHLNSIYANLLDTRGVTLLQGHAKVTGSHTVEVNGQQYSARYILLATGGWPDIPDIPGREYITDSNQIFYLEQLPKRILVVGGGYIALEFASIFNGLGSTTHLSYRRDLFLRGFDREVREHMRDVLQDRGMQLLFNSQVTHIDQTANGDLIAHFENGESLTVDCVFYAPGRRPMLDNLGLETVNVTLTDSGCVKVNENYETSEPGILAIGDIIEGPELTPVALAEGMAVARRLFSQEAYRPVNYENIPSAVFTLPNIATVGLTEEQAIAEGYRVSIFTSRFRPMKLSLSTQQERIFMKLVVDKPTDRVLGCHMVGPDAGELIQGLAVALKAGATKETFDETIGIHPTTAEEFVTMRTPARN